MALAKAIKSMKTQPATVIKKPVIAPRVIAPPRVTAPPRPAPPRAPIRVAPRAPTPIQGISKDDPFYKSPEYKSFQNNPANRMGTADMYDSPYFGIVGSGSIGRAQDAAYRKYKGIAEPTPPEISNPPQFPNANFGNFGNGLSEAMIRDLAGRYALNANELIGNFRMPDANALFGNRQPQYPNQQMPNNGFANQLPITRFPDTNQPFMQPSTSPNGMTQYRGNVGYPASIGSFGQLPTSYNQINPMQQPMQGYPLYPADNQMNPMQQPMQGYQQQPMLPQSSYQLQQPQHPPQQSMYPASGGFGNTMQNQNQNQNQNIGGLFGAIEAMNKNNFSY